MSNKTRNLIGWALTALISFAFIYSAYIKLFSSDADILKAAANFGLSVASLRQLGIVEIICIGLFIIPRTGLLGTLLVAAYMGGAIATHFEHQMPIMIPVILQSLAWITAAIRFPELSQRLLGTKANV